jgi:hypothetical protein
MNEQEIFSGMQMDIMHQVIGSLPTTSLAISKLEEIAFKMDILDNGKIDRPEHIKREHVPMHPDDIVRETKEPTHQAVRDFEDGLGREEDPHDVLGYKEGDELGEHEYLLKIARYGGHDSLSALNGRMERVKSKKKKKKKKKKGPSPFSSAGSHSTFIGYNRGKGGNEFTF